MAIVANRGRFRSRDGRHPGGVALALNQFWTAFFNFNFRGLGPGSLRERW
jgi:hypothetical protein